MKAIPTNKPVNDPTAAPFGEKYTFFELSPLKKGSYKLSKLIIRTRELLLRKNIPSANNPKYGPPTMPNNCITT